MCSSYWIHGQEPLFYTETGGGDQRLGYRRRRDFHIDYSDRHWRTNLLVIRGNSGGRVDTSQIFAARIGVRNDNDIVWVGRAANYAAKLTEISTGHPIYITGEVFDRLHESSKYGGDPKTLMWEKARWTQMNDMTVYRSHWIWSIT